MVFATLTNQRKRYGHNKHLCAFIRHRLKKKQFTGSIPPPAGRGAPARRAGGGRVAKMTQSPLYKKVDSVSHETILLHSKKVQKSILLLYRHLVAYFPCVECYAIPLHKRQCALGLQRHWAIALAFSAPRT